mgnify:CR=1 FL=1
MVLKVAVEDRFQFKVVPNFRNFCLLKQSDVHYIGGTDVLPAPLAADEEADAISKLGTQDEKGAKSQLIEHNLRLVVYIAKKFDNTGVGVEDLISIGTIGLIKAINSYNPEKNIKLATYASRCIENEILMYLRRNNKTKAEVSIDEPLNVDWDGNELLLSDILGTDEEIKEAMVLDYMTGAYSLLRSSYLDMQYGEKQEYTFTVTQKGRNTWSIGDEELNGFIERILELDKL